MGNTVYPLLRFNILLIEYFIIDHNGHFEFLMASKFKAMPNLSFSLWHDERVKIASITRLLAKYASPATFRSTRFHGFRGFPQILTSCINTVRRNDGVSHSVFDIYTYQHLLATDPPDISTDKTKR